MTIATQRARVARYGGTFWKTSDCLDTVDAGDFKWVSAKAFFSG
jgi:hypothetical protein